MISPVHETSLLQTGLLPALISDYIGNKGSVKELYKYPFDISSFEAVLKDKAKDNTDRALLVEVLKVQYADIATSGQVEQNIASLLSENTFTITTAHQPCLFLGPLYFVYKISSVIGLTRELKKAYPAYNFVPVFWLGSEDHDTSELNNTYVNGKKIEWTEAGSGAMGRVSTASLGRVIEELKATVSSTELTEAIEKGAKQYSTFGKFTQYLVNYLFKEQGLVVIDQDDIRLKKQLAPVIKEEILNSRAVSTLQSNLDYIEANYKLQAKPRDINFFYLGDGYRERIILNTSTGKYEVNNTDVSFTKEEILAEIDAHPDRFSPNVIYRPLYQEMILPNLAFVGGAGELSYWLELKPLFEYFKVNYPMQVMRNSAFITPQPIQKKLEKVGLDTDDFFGDIEQLINRYVKENMPPDTHLNGEKAKLDELFTALAAKAEAVDATLKQSVAGEKQKALAAMDNIEAKIVKAEKRKQETAITQIRSIHAALFPEGTLQERRENFMPFYDAEFIATLVANLNPLTKSFITFV